MCFALFPFPSFPRSSAHYSTVALERPTSLHYSLKIKSIPSSSALKLPHGRMTPPSIDILPSMHLSFEIVCTPYCSQSTQGIFNSIERIITPQLPLQMHEECAVHPCHQADDTPIQNGSQYQKPHSQNIPCEQTPFSHSPRRRNPSAHVLLLAQ